MTLFFSDVEGSTRLVRQLGDEYATVLGELQRILRVAVADKDGREIDCRADELFAVFGRARDAVAAATAVQLALVSHTWPEGLTVWVRIGLHTGEPAVAGDVYLGLDVNRAARICAAAHGGQILVSQTTRDLVGDTSTLRDLGSYSLRGLDQPERLFQLLAPGLRQEFPPPRAESTERRRRRAPKVQLRRSRQPTLEDAAWQVRGLLPEMAPELHGALAELGAELFTAHRATLDAEQFLAEIDRRRLDHRLHDQQQLAVVSQQAQSEVATLQQQIASVDDLLVCLEALARLAAELPSTLNRSLTATEIVSLAERTTAATRNLDQAVTKTAAAIEPASYKLTRTRHRGVYRSGDKYVVPFADEFGRERRREFPTLAEAHDFRTALRLTERAQKEYDGGPNVPPPYGGSNP